MQWRKMLLPFSVPILLLVIALSTVPSAMAQSTYSWGMDCKAASGFEQYGGYADTVWNWTLNGVSIAGNTSYCGTTGSGTVPSNANGIIAHLYVNQEKCHHNYYTSQSFNPGSVPRISLKGSCAETLYGTPYSIEATFKLS